MPKDRGITKLPNGRMEIRARVIDPRTGKRREVRRQREMIGIKKARQLQAQWRQELLHPEKETEERLTLSAYARRWMKSRAAEGDRPSTMEGRIQILEQHILPQLGDRFVDSITGKDVRQWRDDSAARIKPPSKSRLQEKKPYGPVTVNGWLRVLKVMLRDAVVDLELERDPTLRISSLKVEPSEEGKSLTAEELSTFLKVAKGMALEGHITHANYVLMLMGFLTGLRWSELTALEWKDLDWEQGSVSVRRAQVRGQVSGTKTRKVRTVAVPEVVLDELKKLKEQQEADKVPGVENGLVFPSRNGGYRFPSSIRKTLNNVCKRAEISRHVTPHGMRHTFNNLMRQAKVDHIVLRASTGHNSEGMTEHYSHVDFKEKMAASNKVVELVGIAASGRKGVEKG